MLKNRLLTAWDQVRTGLWLLPSLMVAAGVGLAWAMLAVDAGRGAGAAAQEVRAEAAFDHVGARPAVDGVVAARPEDGVGAGPAMQPVRAVEGPTRPPEPAPGTAAGRARGGG
jgi:hypothetical protein